MSDDFSDFLNDTITIEPFLSRDAYGTATYGPAVTYECRVSGSQKQLVDASGVQRVSKATINLAGTPAIGPTDRLTMPAGFSPQQPPLLMVNPLTDEAGLPHHTEITV
jgi:hypothetical protein